MNNSLTCGEAQSLAGPSRLINVSVAVIAQLWFGGSQLPITESITGLTKRLEKSRLLIHVICFCYYVT